MNREFADSHDPHIHIMLVTLMHYIYLVIMRYGQLVMNCRDIPVEGILASRKLIDRVNQESGSICCPIAIFCKILLGRKPGETTALYVAK